MKKKKRALKGCFVSGNRKIFHYPTGLNHFLSKKKGREKTSSSRIVCSANLRTMRKLLEM